MDRPLFFGGLDCINSMSGSFRGAAFISGIAKYLPGFFVDPPRSGLLGLTNVLASAPRGANWLLCGRKSPLVIDSPLGVDTL
jgi:hypothetical protein